MYTNINKHYFHTEHIKEMNVLAWALWFGYAHLYEIQTAQGAT